ncbi:MAG: hypothetical protein HYX38_01415 [Rhodospirillales bacterium]|nr:hypothetical protein [Rhodospirillales bacterium]
MAYALDTLSYAKRLRDAGIAQQQAEAHAEAAREFVMGELVTKADLQAVKADLQVVKADLLAAMDTLSLRLTLRLGVMLAAGLATLAAVIKL